jgi:FKBP-type peptidyl-prolyl cis-trans isomerase FkpA
MWLRPFIISVVVLASLSACGTYSEEDKADFDRKIESYVAARKWNMEKTSTGLYVEEIAPGDTTAEKVRFTSELSLLYKGKLLNGSVVDQTRPGKPLAASLNGLIGGFQEGLLDRHLGSKVRLVIPPQLGYGDENKGKIPANSVLVFEVEIVDVR